MSNFAPKFGTITHIRNEENDDMVKGDLVVSPAMVYEEVEKAETAGNQG